MKTFEDLFSELQHETATRPEDSGTVEELDRGVHFVGKKLVEEAAEAWTARKRESSETVCEEISQLLYHTQVMMLAKGYNLQNIYRYLQSPSPLTPPTRLPHHRSGTAVLRIAIPNKGSLSDPTITMLSEAGYRTRRTGRELVLVDKVNDVKSFFLRPRDIAVYVGQDTVHTDIIGHDLLLDSGVDTVEHLPLGLARFAFRFTTPKGAMSSLTSVVERRVATPYDVPVRSYLTAGGVDVQIVHLDGVMEFSVQLGVADLIADVAETDTTLRATDLETSGDPILVSGTVFITIEQFRTKSGLAMLVWQLKGVLRVRAYMLVDCDTPMNKLYLATSLTPDIESPIVPPLQNPDWVAVHAVVPQVDTNRIVDELYEVGARAILVSSLLAYRL